MYITYTRYQPIRGHRVDVIDILRKNTYNDICDVGNGKIGTTLKVNRNNRSTCALKNHLNYERNH
jgi:hypothetical protein